VCALSDRIEVRLEACRLSSATDGDARELYHIVAYHPAFNDWPGKLLQEPGRVGDCKT